MIFGRLFSTSRVITNPYDLEGEVEMIVEMFQGGLSELHINKPSYSRREMMSFIFKIPSIYHNRIVLHQHINLADEFGVKGIYLPAKALRTPWFSKWRVRRWQRTLLVYAPARKASDIQRFSFCDHVLVGPVFTKLSESIHRNVWKEKLPDIPKEYMEHKAIAFGGVYPETMDALEAMGFRHALLNGAIWKTGNPVKALASFQNDASQDAAAIA